jgi:hypothetical protein
MIAPIIWCRQEQMERWVHLIRKFSTSVGLVLVVSTAMAQDYVQFPFWPAQLRAAQPEH